MRLPPEAFTIAPDPLRDPEVLALLDHHLEEMHRCSPACKVHALDATRLKEPGVTFHAARHEGRLAAVGALKRLGDGRGEIKSMRASEAYRGRGAGEAMLLHLIDAAREEGLTWLGLETGRHAVFEPALRLYAKHGFTPCEAYADYVIDDFSQCMGLRLKHA
ncbi:GNAT family N-acetyltransferase [Aurantiacibacter poecillastricola]|uniref:GNAT family N-acetyltransferase n=1 Tax=Aurantiacibacter poecillastricola TaxID=3064385 RepID=UPI00273F8854|nr:GNAT family N-acetyltransferase [Aurantiacibacter sp. 219JJ12-13]MDP5261094.1 GNAT family N-acetyltransferase [Aurantiacibacter sp. 219JJ12-13]